jgi:hypothetical protein
MIYKSVAKHHIIQNPPTSPLQQINSSTKNTMKHKILMAFFVDSILYFATAFNPKITI